ncbi:hypothetical protein [Teredinibacter sp. KSP-S5-2]|uniref:hypothetical protein n=1 Tax=Teredinibacter sp. KSP-S5-2 TaxID=3034506 RepID=UPI002934E03E|nr:hypothetical protein [Teredinibacter sp. KSP-S5-2]WNO11237.1 hypothetical protein P5V12_08630 [Teredinibacter sp. KSP-S5-2]
MALVNYADHLQTWWSDHHSKFDPRNYSRTHLIITGSIVSVILCLFWASLFLDIEHSGKYYDAQRNYKILPFDLLDATSICEQKTQKRYGDKMISSYIDNHSTYFDRSTYLYKVFMFARVGELRDSEEVVVHCFVNPSEYMVEHYRAFEPKKGSLMNRAVGSLGG